MPDSQSTTFDEKRFDATIRKIESCLHSSNFIDVY